MLLQLIFVFISFIQLFFDTFIRPIILISVNSDTILTIQALMNTLAIIYTVITVLSFIVPVVLFLYFSRRHYRFANGFLYLIGLSIISIIVPPFINTMTHTSVYIIFIYLRSMLSFVLTIILWFKASRTYIVRCIEIEPQTLE